MSLIDFILLVVERSPDRIEKEGFMRNGRPDCILFLHILRNSLLSASPRDFPYKLTSSLCFGVRVRVISRANGPSYTHTSDHNSTP